LLFLIAAETSWAHNPIIVDGGPTDAATAYRIDDVSVSRVAYHHAKPEQPFLWLTFNGKTGQEFDLQMGVPKIDRYARVRPATAILGPGLPSPMALPFDVPEGMGAVVFSTAGEEPREFDEEFTGTPSWMFAKKTLTLPRDGQYYTVSYLPSGAEGKLWVAPGDSEAFGLWDFVRMPAVIVKIRHFHEVFPWGGILGWAYLVIVPLLIGCLAGFAVVLRRILRRLVLQSSAPAR
jgi:hypothetical protein